MFYILTDKYKVDTAEAQLSDAQEHICDHPGHRSQSPQCGGGRGQETRVGHVTVGQVAGPCPPAQLLAVVHQQVHAVDTDDTHHHQANVTNYDATVLDSIGHGQDTCANVALEQVNDDICVADLVFVGVNNWSIFRGLRAGASKTEFHINW